MKYGNPFELINFWVFLTSSTTPVSQCSAKNKIVFRKSNNNNLEYFR